MTLAARLGPATEHWASHESRTRTPAESSQIFSPVDLGDGFDNLRAVNPGGNQLGVTRRSPLAAPRRSVRGGPDCAYDPTAAA